MFLLAIDPELIFFAKAISRVLGWVYFLAWYVADTSQTPRGVPSTDFLCRSASFYPQPISNYQRKSTLGLAIDFPTLNVLGFIAYTISTTAFYRSKAIQSQYAARHPEAPETTVRFNDWLFAAHGAVLTIVIYSQFFPRVWGFKVGARQVTSKPVLGIFWGCVVGILFTVGLVLAKGREGGYDARGWAWLDVVCLIRCRTCGAES